LDETDIVISFLPLSHIAAQMLDMHVPMTTGTQVYFAQADALKGSLGATLKEVSTADGGGGLVLCFSPFVCLFLLQSTFYCVVLVPVCQHSPCSCNHLCSGTMIVDCFVCSSFLYVLI
jgi:hypothetical protein